MLFLLAQVDLSKPDPPWHPEVPLREGHTDQTQTIVAPALRKGGDDSGPSPGVILYHAMAYPIGTRYLWTILGDIWDCLKM